MFPEGEYDDNSYRHEVKLMDVVDKHIFYDKLTFVYLEMPKFNKTEDQLESMFDKWMFALKNLYRLLDRPQALQDRIFTKLFEQAEIAQYTPEERREYETSIKDYRDYINTLDTAEQTGFANGRIAERIDIAKNLKAMGMSAEQIAKGTGLTLSEINKL
ncbi:MAG: Rpn family recombination-promoting nuclease/putative transposase, partial [Bacteroidaceae bacterium]|nr:Rpn family recombination-promoting nuclease/putative transposase [Bacteroidaceae bacterium]